MVGSGNYPQGSIGFVAVVQMDADGKHIFQYRYRRLDVENSCFHRPRTKAGNIPSFPHRNGEVLMPRHFPVGLQRLVEENTPNRECFRAQN